MLFLYGLITRVGHVLPMRQERQFRQMRHLSIPKRDRDEEFLAALNVIRLTDIYANGSETSELTNFKTLVKPFLDELEAVRLEIKNTEKVGSNDSIIDVKDYANAANDDYFQVLSKYSDVKTLVLRHPFSVVKSNMRQHYYQYGGSNCSLIDDPPRFGGNFSQLTFNKTCQEDLKKLIDPEEMPLTQFKPGIPENVKYNETSMPLTFISVFPDAVVRTFGDVRHRSLYVIPQQCHYKIKLKKNWKNHYREVFTIAQNGGRKFYHATVEDISRIAPYVEFLRRHPSIYIHVTSEKSATRTFLAMLGITSDRLIKGTIQADILYLPAGSPCGLGVFFSTQMLSAYLRNTFTTYMKWSHKSFIPDEEQSISNDIPSISDDFNGQQQRTVILEKRNKAARSLRNHDAIERALRTETESRGLKLEIFTDQPLPTTNETMAMFDRAVLVVAPHGAGESNLLFSRPGTPLVEVLCHPRRLCYRNLMQQLGLRYYGVLTHDMHCRDSQPEHILPAVKFFLDNLVGKKHTLENASNTTS